MSLTTVNKPERLSLRDQIYQSLREALMSGAFAPGQTITIMALAEQMETSAMPVREALRQLVASRAVEMLPNRSMMVPVLSSEEFREITTLRIHVESSLAARAAALIGPVDIQKMRNLEEEMNQMAAARKLDSYLRCNREFHFTMYRAADMNIYLSAAESLWLRVGPLIRYALNDREFESSSENHRLAIDALKQHDGPAAWNAIAEDISAAAEEIRGAFDFNTDGDALLATNKNGRRASIMIA